MIDISTVVMIGGFAVSIGSMSIAVLRLNNNHKKNNSTNGLDKKYKRIDICDEIHKNVNEKLSCLPDIKKSVTQIETKIDILINGK